jgi:hypothetical protein
VKPLRRALYLQAAVWAAAGLALALAPRLLLVSLFRQPEHPDYTWFRLLGLHVIGLAMLMVLVGHCLEDLWWWSWAFALVTVGMAAIVLLNAAFGLEPGESGVLWWAMGGLSLVFSMTLLWGLFVSAQEHPVP